MKLLYHHQLKLLSFLLSQGKKNHRAVVSESKAMRVLGLGGTAVDKNKMVKAISVKQYTEDQILLAFQRKCEDLGQLHVCIESSTDLYFINSQAVKTFRAD